MTTIKRVTDKETEKRSESEIDDSMPTIERVAINKIVNATKENEMDKGMRQEIVTADFV